MFIAGGLKTPEEHPLNGIFTAMPAKILPLGYKHLLGLNKTPAVSDQVFVACKFDEAVLSVVNDYIKPAVIDAGYKYVIVNNEEFVGRIDDKIIAEIRKSKFIIADLTGHKPNVYYEAGYAMGHGIPVLLTCKRTGKKKMDQIHFDISPYNCIYWKQNQLDEFRNRVQNRIEAVFGQGPVPPPE